jgi:hypothetical protein
VKLPDDGYKISVETCSGEDTEYTVFFLVVLVWIYKLIFKSILLLLLITFTQGIYNYIPETNHVLYSVSAIL